MCENSEWYLYEAAGAVGPYSKEEIISFINTGAITAEWYIWREGFTDWMLISDVPDLNPVSNDTNNRSEGKKLIVEPDINPENSYYIILKNNKNFDFNTVSQNISKILSIPVQDTMINVKKNWGVLQSDKDIDKIKNISNKLNSAGMENFILSSNQLIDGPNLIPVIKGIIDDNGFTAESKDGQILIEWPDIIMVCAGQVHETVSKKRSLTAHELQLKARSDHFKSSGMGIGGAIGHSMGKAIGNAIDVKSPQKTTKKNIVLYFDIYCRESKKSIRIAADKFDYSILGDKKQFNALENLKSLIQLIEPYFINPLKNKGYTAIISRNPTPQIMKELKYDSSDSYEKEKYWFFQVLRIVHGIDNQWAY